MFERTHKVVFKSLQPLIHFLFWMLFSCGLALAQENADIGAIELPVPSSVVSKYIYDPETDRYIFSEEIGGYPISIPLVLTVKQYESLVLKEQMQLYFCLLYTSPSPRDATLSRMPSSA